MPRFDDAVPWIRDALNLLLRAHRDGLDPRPAFHRVFDEMEEGVEVFRGGRRVLDCWNKQTRIRLGIFDRGWSVARVSGFDGVEEIAQMKDYVRAYVGEPTGLKVIESICRIQLAE